MTATKLIRKTFSLSSGQTARSQQATAQSGTAFMIPTQPPLKLLPITISSTSQSLLHGRMSMHISTAAAISEPITGREPAGRSGRVCFPSIPSCTETIRNKILLLLRREVITPLTHISISFCSSPVRPTKTSTAKQCISSNVLWAIQRTITKLSFQTVL